jgi:hypothetical protein
VLLACLSRSDFCVQIQLCLSQDPHPFPVLAPSLANHSLAQLGRQCMAALVNVKISQSCDGDKIWANDCFNPDVSCLASYLSSAWQRRCACFNSQR